MRIRTIKPDIFTDEKTGELSGDEFRAFVGLLCAADREGRLEDRPKSLRVKIMPYRECDFDAILATLHRVGLIVRYEVNGESYIQVKNFTEHQRINNKELPSTIPPCLYPDATRLNLEKGDSIPDEARLNLDEGEVEGNMEGKGKGNIPPPTPQACPEIEYCPETGKVERGRELEAIQEKRAVAAAVQSEIDPMAAMYSQGIETLCEAWKAAKKAKGMPGVVDGKTKEGLALLAGMVERGDLSIDQAKAVVSRFINHPDRNRPDDKWGAMAMAKNFTRFLSPEPGMNRPPGDSSGKWIDAKCPKCGSKSAAFVGKSPKEVVCPNDKCKAKFTVGG